MTIKIAAGCNTRETRRRSSNSVWPLRRADNRTWAEAKREQQEKAA